MILSADSRTLLLFVATLVAFLAVVKCQEEDDREFAHHFLILRSKVSEAFSFYVLQCVQTF